jgi:hypothetical protein
MDRYKNVRNVAIILALAVAVWKLPGGGTAARVVSNIFSVLFLGGLFFFGFRMYKEHRDTLYTLEERQRAILYGALGLAAFAFAATNRMWNELDLLGGMLWLAMLGAAAWAIYSVWQAYRTY